MGFGAPYTFRPPKKWAMEINELKNLKRFLKVHLIKFNSNHEFLKKNNKQKMKQTVFLFCSEYLI